MVKAGKMILRFFKWLIIAIIVSVLLFFLVCFVGRRINSITPKGGINTSEYVEINGSMQWISIYSEDKSNPVLLYLHGGPCVATSFLDFPLMKKLGKDYTVVNWDQRGCGHNYKVSPYNETLTPELVMADGVAMTEYLKERFDTDKIALLGSSWGSVLGSNLVLEHPENYTAMVSTSSVVDTVDSQQAFKDRIISLTENDPESRALAESIDPYTDPEDSPYKLNELEKKYCYKENFFKAADYGLLTGIMFDPYASLDQIGMLTFDSKEFGAYRKNLCKSTFYMVTPMSLKGRFDYKVPVYYLVGSEDQHMFSMNTVAKEYYDNIKAPDKEFRYVKGGHYAATLCSEELSSYLHEIKERTVK
ncbi:MAG: alpha/beta fold hydrolase [Ruminococcus sp.]|nr:alpha/beta fold hydrolase [Ruminococcus sp.]